MQKPNYSDGPDYCRYFFDLVPENDLLSALHHSSTSTIQTIENVAPDLENYAYAAEKWSIKEVLRHIVDYERVYTYRAFRFSRFDATDLAGFDENMYILNARILEESLSDLLEAYKAQRAVSISLFKHLTPEMLDFRGKANRVTFTARALGYMTVGHNLHHLQVIKERYLLK